MKKPKRVRRKARFYKGQVVAKCSHFYPDRHMWVSGHGAVIRHESREGDDGYLLECLGCCYTNKMSNGTRMYLRPLTKRERGQ